MLKGQMQKQRPQMKIFILKNGARMILPVLMSFYLLMGAAVRKGAEKPEIPIIPKPAQVEKLGGEFLLDNNTKIVLANESEELRSLGQELAAKLRKATGFPVELVQGVPLKPKDLILLELNENKKYLGLEGYDLSVSKSLIKINAWAPAGLFYGIQSLNQLLPVAVEIAAPASNVRWAVPCVKITDKPRFPWRGVHLDVGRHFYPKEFIKKYIDLIAMYKMNTFHWHLTEDQGWRIEIKKYPKLTEFGAWRKETMDDGQWHGDFYTQDDIREIVAYAKSRYVTIVPEIEMPGHCLAALASYPELSCSGGPFDVGTKWGVIYDVYCAGNEKTFDFLQDVLSEVIDLFPGEYLHIGGDEVPKLRWQNCVKCQERIKAEALKDENELQSYFVKRIEKFLNSKGRKLIGWDEILEGGLAPNATVMSWRGTMGGIAAAKAGHDVVMTPTSHCYFDHYQGLHSEPKAIGGFSSLEKVYSYEPVPAELSPQESKCILGAQANIWTEYMKDSSQVEYMLMPRLAALSEVVWSEKGQRNYASFSQRMIPHYDRLAAKNVNFRVPPPEGLSGRRVIFGKTLFKLENMLPGTEIRYTLDGSDPTPESLLYTKPIEIEGDATIKAETIMKNGSVSYPLIISCFLANPDLNGLEYKYYEGKWEKMPDVSALTPVKTGVVYDISLQDIQARQGPFALLFQGFLNIDRDGEYTFFTNTDDDCRLFIDENEVVSMDGPPWLRERSGKITLQQGKHPVKILYFENAGNQRLEVLFDGPQIEKQPIPPRLLIRKQFFERTNITR